MYLLAVFFIGYSIVAIAFFSAGRYSKNFKKEYNTKEDIMNWIELHDSVTNGEIFININNIEDVFTREVSAGEFATSIDVVDGTQYTVKETYEEVKNKIIYCDEYLWYYGKTSN